MCVRASVVHRAAVHLTNAREIPARPDLPTSRQDSSSAPLQSRANHLLRGYHGCQGDHHHIARVSSYGQTAIALLCAIRRS